LVKIINLYQIFASLKLLLETTLSIMTLNHNQHNDPQHYDTGYEKVQHNKKGPHTLMTPSIMTFNTNADCQYAECHYA
jgi:hypothetical protein